LGSWGKRGWEPAREVLGVGGGSGEEPLGARCSGSWWRRQIRGANSIESTKVAGLLGRRDSHRRDRAEKMGGRIDEGALSSKRGGGLGGYGIK